MGGASVELHHTAVSTAWLCVVRQIAHFRGILTIEEANSLL